MDPVERAANISVARACGFAALAILCIMVGASHDPHLSARLGGSFSLLTALMLWVKAWRAPHIPYKQTETWLLLAEQQRPPAETAQVAISSVLQRTFLVFALYAAVLAALMLGVSVLLQITRG